jgi:hypothetical protein
MEIPKTGPRRQRATRYGKRARDNAPLNSAAKLVTVIEILGASGRSMFEKMADFFS